MELWGKNIRQHSRSRMDGSRVQNQLFISSFHDTKIIASPFHAPSAILSSQEEKVADWMTGEVVILMALLPPNREHRVCDRIRSAIRTRLDDCISFDSLGPDLNLKKMFVMRKGKHGIWNYNTAGWPSFSSLVWRNRKNWITDDDGTLKMYVLFSLFVIHSRGKAKTWIFRSTTCPFCVLTIWG